MPESNSLKKKKSTLPEAARRILARKDSLVITVTHRLNQEILRQYDRILVLSHGKLVALGTYEELQQKKGSRYRDYETGNFLIMQP